MDPLQCCEVISLQLIKINEKKFKKIKKFKKKKRRVLKKKKVVWNWDT